ncbi:MAG TPA: hypothetical protein VFQ30_20825 [Ktedonobacteraceae bacterium]|nr:hypothetical protein [Ktedonobacteraceae bacterium]
MFTQRRMPAYRARRRLSPLMLVGVSVPVVLMILAAIVIVVPRLASHAAAAVNGDCSLIVPPNPLSAPGLATPYQLVATNPNNGPCNEGNAGQAAFVQGAVIDPATGQISVYNPLVIDQGTQPAVAPVAPKLPAGGVVALWFGFNGNNLTLQNANGSLRQGRCVNGADGTIFGQFAYCNAPAFFRVANQAIQQGKLAVPALGTANDGKPCPTVRDFSVVDMDQSDNVTTPYLVTGNGQTAQMTKANVAALQNTQTQTNASDNRLLDVALDGALGCTPWMAPDLADPGQMVPSLPLNELQAAAHQAAPIALVPLGDPMVLNNNRPDLNKVNAYRRGVDQPFAVNQAAASTTTYCNNLITIAPPRLQLDAQFTKAAASPDAAAANSLFTFLAQRYATSFGANGLNCAGLLNKPDPVTVTTDANGVAVDATIGMGNGNGNGNGGNGQGAAPSCTVNGTVIANCAGTTTINGQSCTFAFANNTVNVTCAAAQPQGGNNNNGTGQ